MIICWVYFGNESQITKLNTKWKMVLEHKNVTIVKMYTFRNELKNKVTSLGTPPTIDNLKFYCFTDTNTTLEFHPHEF